MYSIIRRYCKIRYEHNNKLYKGNDCIQFYNLYPMKIM